MGQVLHGSARTRNTFNAEQAVAVFRLSSCPADPEKIDYTV